MSESQPGGGKNLEQASVVREVLNRFVSAQVHVG